MIAEKPDLTKRFLRAIKKSFELARDNPEETCKLHVQKIPEVALDDCLGSVRASWRSSSTTTRASSAGARRVPERLEFTWKAIAEAQELEPDWDYKQAIDTSLVAEMSLRARDRDRERVEASSSRAT